MPDQLIKPEDVMTALDQPAASDLDEGFNAPLLAEYDPSEPCDKCGTMYDPGFYKKCPKCYPDPGPQPSDPGLTATAQLIADLRAKNAALQAQLDALKAAVTQPVPQKEVRIETGITSLKFEDYLNDGWSVLHIGFTADAAGIHANVVFIRDLRPASFAGDRPAARQMVQPVGPTVVLQSPQFPIARALRERGLEAVLRQQNADVLASGQHAFETSMAAHPTPAPTLTPGEPR